MNYGKNFAEVIERRVMNTVGYAGSTDRKAFMVGVKVALSFAEEKINALHETIEAATNNSSEVREDMKTIVSIFEKYKEQSHD